ncbi:MAG: isochorismatase family protein [Thermoplasmata archaeon]
MYLKQGNAAEKVNSWFQRLGEFRGRKNVRGLKAGTENAVLIVIDLQRYFTHPDSHAFVPSSGVVIENINKIIPSFRTVVYTRHIDREDSGMLKWWGRGLFEGDNLSGIDPRIKVEGMVVSKSTYSAFYKTELESFLERHLVKRVYITGLLTNLCCETTARDAFVRGYEVFFVADATATYTEELHLATLLNLSHGFAYIVSTDEVMGVG